MTRKMNNQGFTILELIISVTILAVMVGVIAPQYLKYVEKTKRVTDINNAKMIRDTFERAATEYMTTYDEKKGTYIEGIMISYRTKSVENPSNTQELAVKEMGEVPKSATNENYWWLIYMGEFGQVEKIYLTTNPNIKEWEVYPDYTTFLNH